MNKKSVLLFGVGELQKSIINRAKLMGLFVVGIDPYSDAYCKDLVDVFEVIDGQDLEGTLAVAEKYSISAVITTATDKPLVMMAKVAERLNLPFYSVKTAMISTDKQLMKNCFEKNNIPCAKGKVIKFLSQADEFNYPVIIKPRDNSGSRGVKYCANYKEYEQSFHETMQYTYKNSILVEEYIEGSEYSIEAVHYHDKTHIIQYTKKVTTNFPYNVELGHIQPADLNDSYKLEIERIINQLAVALKFKNCCSHTELKINDRGIFIIEASPRLGGDFITSTLVPLSTGINIEDLLLRISLGEIISDLEFKPIYNKASGIIFFELIEGTITHIGNLNQIASLEGCQGYSFNRKIGDNIKKITSSLNRYGQAIFQAENVYALAISIDESKRIVKNKVLLK